MLRAALPLDVQCRQIRELLDRCNLLISASIGGRQVSDQGKSSEKAGIQISNLLQMCKIMRRLRAR